MNRSAVLTLGAIVTLAGLGASRADELSLPDWPSLWSFLSATTEIFPRGPENWGDLPLQFHVSEQTGYNSNIANSPTGSGASSAGFARPIGTLETISTYGASFKEEIGGQQLFADGSWGMYRYFNNDDFNSAHSSVDIGDNFTYGSKCSGTLKASEASSPSIPGQQVGVNVINTLTTTGITENAKCIISGNYAGIFNSGTTTSKNSSIYDALNNNQSAFIAAGMTYTVSATNSLQVLATITGINYTDRQLIANQSGVSNGLTTDQVIATYTKNFGPTISLNAQLGVLGFSDTNWDLGLPHTVLPQYAFSAQWNVTPKLALNAAASRLASAPTAIVSNLQITESASAGASYAFTPKLAFSANVQTSLPDGGGLCRRLQFVAEHLYDGAAQLWRQRKNGLYDYAVPRRQSQLPVHENRSGQLDDERQFDLAGPQLQPLLRLRTWSATMRMNMRMVRFGIPGFVALALAALVGAVLAGAPAYAEGGRVLTKSDVVTIKVVSQPDMDTTSRVELDGTVQFPYVGRIKAAGLTEDGLARAIERRLAARQIVNDPHVLVEIANFGSEVSVQGQVGAPGLYTVDRPTTLTEILARAGGLKDSGATVVLQRSGPNGKTVQRYAGPDIVSGKINGDHIFVQNNDEIYVELVPFYYVYGYVGKTGEFPLTRPLTVQQAIAIAGGLTPLGTDWRLKVKRRAADGQTMEMPASLDDEVQPNDTIVVNERLF